MLLQHTHRHAKLSAAAARSNESVPISPCTHSHVAATVRAIRNCRLDLATTNRTLVSERNGCPRDTEQAALTDRPSRSTQARPLVGRQQHCQSSKPQYVRWARRHGFKQLHVRCVARTETFCLKGSHIATDCAKTTHSCRQKSARSSRRVSVQTAHWHGLGRRGGSSLNT
jgi:hypothetical protein